MEERRTDEAHDDPSVVSDLSLVTTNDRELADKLM